MERPDIVEGTASWTPPFLGHSAHVCAILRANPVYSSCWFVSLAGRIGPGSEHGASVPSWVSLARLALTEPPSYFMGVSVELRRQGPRLPRLRSGIHIHCGGTGISRLEGLRERALAVPGLPRRPQGRARWR